MDGLHNTAAVDGGYNLVKLKANLGGFFSSSFGDPANLSHFPILT
jgi:hypothetical protein